MRTTTRFFAFAAVMAGLTFSSCKKDKTPDPADPDESGIFAQHAADESNSSTSADMSMDDAETVLGVSSLGGYKTTSYPGLCGATADTTNISSGTVVITYTGTSCDGLRTRTGSITVHVINFPTVRWRDAGAMATITYNNFKVTSLLTGKATTLNGTHTITNVSGGLVWHIGVGSNPASIVRKIRSSNMSLTFDDGTQRTWSVARRRTWTGAGGVATALSISGDTTIGSNVNVAVWGTNRAGNSFITMISTPISVSSACGWYAPTAGVKTHKINNRIVIVTFGTDASGNVVATGCPTHYKIDWTSVSGAAKSYVGAY